MNKGYQILQFLSSKKLVLVAVGTVAITAVAVGVAVGIIKNKADNGELDILSNNEYSSGVEFTSEIVVSLPDNIDVEIENEGTETEPQTPIVDNETPSTPQVCTHKYKKETLEPTCSAQGYTNNVCELCGDKYTDAYTEPKHSYGKYLCDYCNKPDPSNPMYALNAWLSKEGELIGGDRFASLIYTDSTGEYNISTSLYYDIDYSFEYVNGSEIFRVNFGTDYSCNIFYKDTTGASCTTYELKNSAVSSKLDVKTEIEDFYQGDTDFTQDQIAQKLSEKITPVLKVIEEKLLTPKTGYNLKDLGFTMF